MKLNADQLPQQLKQSLATSYLISGDEVLLVQEAALAIKQRAAQLGFVDRQLFVYEKGFDWESLVYEAQNDSLFVSQKIIELKLNTNAIGEKGSAALTQLVSQQNDNTLLLITGPKLDQSGQRTKWVKSINAQGVFVQVWPVDAQQLPQWIRTRARNRQIELSDEALVLLIDRVEGNLLAATQEIEKLWLINGAGMVDDELVKQSITDSAKYNVYTLVDYCLSGHIAKIAHVLEGLKAEGVEPVLISWALTREIRTLCHMSMRCANGESIESVLMEYRVWERRKPLIRSGLSRYRVNQWFQILAECEKIDRQIKGLDRANVWDSLLRLSLVLGGLILFRQRAKKAAPS